MSRGKKHLETLLYFCVLISLSRYTYAAPFDEPPPLSFEVRMSGFTSGGIPPGRTFGFVSCLRVFKEPVLNIRMSITPPPEAEKTDKGPELWEGDLVPDKRSWLDKLIVRFHEKKECIDLTLKSRTDWSEWSAPIKAKVSFSYRGEKYSRTINWSHKGVEYEPWQGKNAAELFP